MDEHQDAPVTTNDEAAPGSPAVTPVDPAREVEASSENSETQDVPEIVAETHPAPEIVVAGEPPAEAEPDVSPAADAAPRRPTPSDAEFAALRRKAKAAWDGVVAAHASGETVLGTIVSSVKGGLLVDINGIRGFLPASQVRPAEGGTLDGLIKTVVPLKILDLDASRRRAVVSARRALEALRRERRAELLESLAPGQRREAVVVRLTDIGAFVDLGGVDGLIPMSELALERVERAADVLHVGEKLEVEVLRVDAGGNKISLSRKSVLPDPWRDHAAILRPGTIVEGTVVAKEPRLAIEIAPGIVGQMRDADADPADYAVGERVEVAVRSADRRSRRIVLGTPYADAASLGPTSASGFAPLGQELETKRRR
jgi:ribosomal protein S1